VKYKNKKIIKELSSFSIKFYLLSLLYFVYYNSNLNFPFLSYLEANLINVFFHDKIITYPSFISGTVFAIFNEEKNRIFVIDRDCLAINLWFLISIFIFSFPTKIKIKLVFLVISFFLSEILNIFRLTVLYYFFINDYKTYIILHEYIFQFFEFISAIILVFLFLKFKNKF
jgi:exosortase/archaeosortase family protein